MKIASTAKDPSSKGDVIVSYWIKPISKGQPERRITFFLGEDIFLIRAVCVRGLVNENDVPTHMVFWTICDVPNASKVILAVKEQLIKAVVKFNGVYSDELKNELLQVVIDHLKQPKDDEEFRVTVADVKGDVQDVTSLYKKVDPSTMGPLNTAVSVDTTHNVIVAKVINSIVGGQPTYTAVITRKENTVTVVLSHSCSEVEYLIGKTWTLTIPQLAEQLDVSQILSTINGLIRVKCSEAYRGLQAIYNTMNTIPWECNQPFPITTTTTPIGGRGPVPPHMQGATPPWYTPPVQVNKQ